MTPPLLPLLPLPAAPPFPLPPPVSVIDVATQVTPEEGTRLFAYEDTTGNTTIGIGRNLDAVGISLDEAHYMLHNDIRRAMASLDAIAPWWRTLPHDPAMAMVDLCFNMGGARLAKFGQFLGLMRRGQFVAAAADLQTTLWWSQVGTRGPRVAALLHA